MIEGFVKAAKRTGYSIFENTYNKKPNEYLGFNAQKYSSESRLERLLKNPVRKYNKNI